MLGYSYKTKHRLKGTKFGPSKSSFNYFDNSNVKKSPQIVKYAEYLAI